MKCLPTMQARVARSENFQTNDERRMKMKKKYIPAFLFICAALLTIGFAVHLYFDYTLRYEYGSAPFALYVIERFAEYLILAIGCLITGIIMCKKKRSETNEK